MYQNCVEGCSLATNSPLVVMADICQWQKFIMYKNETQKINMEDTLLIMKQINVLNNYWYFYNDYLHREGTKITRSRESTEDAGEIGKLVHYMPYDALCTLVTKVD